MKNGKIKFKPFRDYLFIRVSNKDLSSKFLNHDKSPDIIEGIVDSVYKSKEFDPSEEEVEEGQVILVSSKDLDCTIENDPNKEYSIWCIAKYNIIAVEDRGENE